MTILDACVAVLRESTEPLTVDDIYDRIVAQKLFAFGAKEPLGVVRATIRKHLRQPLPHKVKLVGSNKIQAA